MSSRRPLRLVALVGAALLVAASCTAAEGTEISGHELGAATLALYADSPILVAPETTTTTTEPPAPELPELPVPGPLPLDPYEPAPDDATIGHIEIPRLGIDEPLHEGMSLTVIDRGPSHWPGTAAPGQVGNMVLAGHRTTYSRPFYDLDLVEPGDEMIVTTDDEAHIYVAMRTEVVPDDALWIADQTYEFTATTFACHPKGSARERIVVFWQLVDDDGEPVPALA